MKTITMRKSTLTLALIVGLFNAGSAYANDKTAEGNQQRDPKYMTNTTADCAHGGTGTAENIDCSRDKASRHTTDTNAYNTDTGRLNGSKTVHSDSATVDPADGMTARSVTH